MKIAILTSNTGVEQIELESPRSAMLERGWQVRHLAPDTGEVQTMTGDITKSDVVQADGAVADESVADFDALIIPGGTVNADQLRLDHASIAFVRAFAEAKKPVAAICHGPWALIEAGVLPGKTLTSYPSLRTDIINAGGTWEDKQVLHCTGHDWDLITSRKPGDLEAFNVKTIEVLSARE